MEYLLVVINYRRQLPDNDFLYPRRLSCPVHTRSSQIRALPTALEARPGTDAPKFEQHVRVLKASCGRRAEREPSNTSEFRNTACVPNQPLAAGSPGASAWLHFQVSGLRGSILVRSTCRRQLIGQGRLPPCPHRLRRVFSESKNKTFSGSVTARRDVPRTGPVRSRGLRPRPPPRPHSLPSGRGNHGFLLKHLR